MARFAMAPALAAPLDDLRAAVEAGDSAAAYAGLLRDADRRARARAGIRSLVRRRRGRHRPLRRRRARTRALRAAISRRRARPSRAGSRLFLRRRRRTLARGIRSRCRRASRRPTSRPESIAILPRWPVREARYRGRRLAFVEVGGGYDSNANAGVAQADIGLPVLGPVTVAAFGVRKGVRLRLARGGRRNPSSASHPG